MPNPNVETLGYSRSSLRDGEGQILAALDILVRLCVRLFILVSALVLTDAQGRTRMSALQSHPVDDAGKN